MITALVFSENYKGINATSSTAAEAIDACMIQIKRKANPEKDEIIIGFWTPVGVLPVKNMWLRHTDPSKNQPGAA